jgi:tRNA pseudouridine32 synthase/23S rRNA pseudouridine746 synthase
MSLPAASVKRDPRQSTVHLHPGPWSTVWAALVAQFPRVGATEWLERIHRGRVLDADGTPVTPQTPCRPGMRISYYREVPDEQPIPGAVAVLYQDEHLLVADKPPFLPVVPSGSYLEQTLLRRLLQQTGSADLVPLHRIDRLTAGLVLFSVNPRTRSAYQALFRERRVGKRYLALAPALPALAFPRVHRSRLVRGEPFFRMLEAAGEPNSETRIEVLERGPDDWRYALHPITGRKHQLRVHMAALGAPIRHDPWYPQLDARQVDDHAHPLRLLAQGLAFVDPMSGEPRQFESRRAL